MSRQPSLFGDQTTPDQYRSIDAPGAEFDLYPHAFERGEADQFFETLHSQTPWRHDQILIHGKRIPLPRLQTWYCDDGVELNYSGMRIEPLTFTQPIIEIKKRVYDLTGLSFNGVLVTLYRDGNDSVGWHSDDEPEFGSDPIISSVSFGVTRDFIVKQRHRDDLPPIKCPLTHGSLLLMGPGSQTQWMHHLPKRKRVTDPRIN